MLIKDDFSIKRKRNHSTNRGRNNRPWRHFQGRVSTSENWRDPQNRANIQERTQLRHRASNIGETIKKNPPNSFGQTSRCTICESICHWAAECPHNHEKQAKDAAEQPDFELFSNAVQEGYVEKLVGETLSCALLDSGCTKTVCGSFLLQCYKNSLDEKDQTNIVYEPSIRTFKFGDSKGIKSTHKAYIPAYIGNRKVRIETEVVDKELPLLLSKEAMKKAGMMIDFTNDSAQIFGFHINLEITSSGHYTIALSKTRNFLNNNINQEEEKAFIAVDVDKMSYQEKEKMVTKLHNQFGHPSYDKLSKFLTNAGVKDGQFFDILQEFSAKCDVCLKYKRKNPRPVVGLSLAKEFNDVIAMDLKPLNNAHILHLIDLSTRYSNAVVVKSKHKDVIVKNILQHWIALFGAPNKILSDNGGEFNNQELQDMSENLNIEIMTMAAESPWSNGVCERHNAVIGDMVTKIVAETKCPLDIALAWTVNAKNSLCNAYRYSPNQLVFGRNPNLPSVINDKPPALEGTTSSEITKNDLILNSTPENRL